MAPFPYEAKAGRAGVRQKAVSLFGHYVWLARWSDEMAADADINNKKLGQFMMHCQAYKMIIDDLAASRSGAKIAIEQVFRENDVEWGSRAAMVADLKAIYDKIGTLLPQLEKTFPDIKNGFVSTGLDVNNNIVEVILTKTKTEEFSSQIADFRALWT